MEGFPDKFEIENVKAVGETTKGIWCRHDDWEQDEFVPQSQIDSESEVWKEGQSGTLIVSGWLADQRGWR